MFRMIRAGAILIACGAFVTGAARAQTGPPSGVDQIEEDWQVVIGTPSVEEAGPQITTTISPVGDNTQFFVALNLNYQDSPYQAGGYQVEAWNGNTLMANCPSSKWAQLNTSGETITWTQSMWISNGWLSYMMKNGNSTTWGTFGWAGDWSMFGMPFSPSSLDSYKPAVSVANSGASWQANRVQSMTLVRVRYYSGGALVYTDSTPRSIDLSPSVNTSP